MREFINIVESDNETTEYDREQAVVKVVRHVFTKLGIEPIDSNSGVLYLEDMDRECRVRLADTTVELSILAKLETLGLGRDFKIWGDENGRLSVDFIVSDGIENAEII